MRLMALSGTAAAQGFYGGNSGSSGLWGTGSNSSSHYRAAPTSAVTAQPTPTTPSSTTTGRAAITTRTTEHTGPGHRAIDLSAGDDAGACCARKRAAYARTRVGRSMGRGVPRHAGQWRDALSAPHPANACAGGPTARGKALQASGRHQMDAFVRRYIHENLCYRS
jgi:hypothetical protein